LWRVRWQEHQFNALRNFQILGDMPARAVEHQDDVLVHAGTNLGGERGQERAEQRGVDAVGDEPHDLASGGPDEAVQIKPLVSVMAAGGQPRGAQTGSVSGRGGVHRTPRLRPGSPCRSLGAR
jgi:hypothetical protein